MAEKRFWREGELTAELVENILTEIPSGQESTASRIESEEDDAPKNCISPITTQPPTSASDCDVTNDHDDLGHNNDTIVRKNKYYSLNKLDYLSHPLDPIFPKN